MRTKTTVLAAALFMAFMPIHSSGDWVEDFYNSAGASANVTTAQAISTQSVTGYSGGGITWRVPNKTLTPLQITPPSFRGGCGGIDAYLGSYSFVNKDAFVQALRNFGQAAVGYFFQLALRSMAPEVAVTLDAINDIAQKVNQFGMNSCQAAKWAVDNTAGKVFEGKAHDAENYAREVGTVVDNFSGFLRNQTGGGATIYQDMYAKKYGVAKGSESQAQIATKGPAIDENPLYFAIINSSLNASDDEINLIMSLVGPTNILRQAAADDGDTSLVSDGGSSTIDIKDLVGNPMEANASFKVWVCPGAASADPGCLTPILSTEGSHKTFSRLTQEAMEAIRDAVIARTSTAALTAAHQTVLRLSSVPLFRVAALAGTGGTAGAVANGMMADIAEIAGIDAAINFLNHYLTAVDRTLQASGGKLHDPRVAESMHKRIAELRRQAYAEQTRVYQARGNPFEKLDQLEKIERAMLSNLNMQMAANVRFANRH